MKQNDFDISERRHELKAIASSSGTENDEKFCDLECCGRYLRARKGDLRKAAKMLQSTLTWRASMDIPSFTMSEFEAELRSGKMYVQGNDACGRSIIVTRKKSDAFIAGEYEHYLRHLTFTLETACRSMKGGAESWIWIMDMAGMTRANSPPLSVSLATLRIFADHYPERLHCCFFVDAPTVFSYLWAALSPFIDPVTKNKIKFVKSESWRRNFDDKPLKVPGEGVQAVNDPDFSHYWEVYSSPYNEAQYRQQLSAGWKE